MFQIKREDTRKKIFEEFWKPRFRYKGIPVNFFGLPTFSDPSKKSMFSNEFSRLRRLGLIEKDSEFMRLTPKGKEYIKKRQESLKNFSFNFLKSSPKDLIIMFDIPERKKAEREWFRFHLKKLGFVMIQRSVWVGPSPIPKEFYDYLEEIKLTDCLKTFKLAKGYKIDSQI